MGGFTTLELGGVVIPITSAHSFSQTYAPLGGSVVLRMLDGGAVKQQHWEKIRTGISGEGVLPPGIENLSFKDPLVLKCGAVRGTTSVSPTGIAIPVERRSDAGFLPEGFAWVPDTSEPSLGAWVSTSIVINAGPPDTADLGAVAGATQYRITYFPEITVFADPPEVETDVHGKAVSWSIDAEQV
jgi:hypothetical protein